MLEVAETHGAQPRPIVTVPRPYEPVLRSVLLEMERISADRNKPGSARTLPELPSAYWTTACPTEAFLARSPLESACTTSEFLVIPALSETGPGSRTGTCSTYADDPEETETFTQAEESPDLPSVRD